VGISGGGYILSVFQSVEDNIMSNGDEAKAEQPPAKKYKPDLAIREDGSISEAYKNHYYDTEWVSSDGAVIKLPGAFASLISPQIFASISSNCVVDSKFRVQRSESKRTLEWFADYIEHVVTQVQSVFYTGKDTSSFCLSTPLPLVAPQHEMTSDLVALFKLAHGAELKGLVVAAEMALAKIIRETSVNDIKVIKEEEPPAILACDLLYPLSHVLKDTMADWLIHNPGSLQLLIRGPLLLSKRGFLVDTIRFPRFEITADDQKNVLAVARQCAHGWSQFWKCHGAQYVHSKSLSVFDIGRTLTGSAGDAAREMTERPKRNACSTCKCPKGDVWFP